MNFSLLFSCLVSDLLSKDLLTDRLDMSSMKLQHRPGGGSKEQDEKLSII